MFKYTEVATAPSSSTTIASVKQGMDDAVATLEGTGFRPSDERTLVAAAVKPALYQHLAAALTLYRSSNEPGSMTNRETAQGLGQVLFDVVAEIEEVAVAASVKHRPVDPIAEIAKMLGIDPNELQIAGL